jgi:hypothetical protein
MTTLAREVPVWIEDQEGAIVRGTAESVDGAGASVRLSVAPGFHEGAGVTFRIRFDPESPTAAGQARVSWIRSDDGPSHCGLEWTQLEQALERWLEDSGQ